MSGQEKKAPKDHAKSRHLSPDVIKSTVDGAQRYAMVGLVIGALVILGGIALIVLGFSGSVDITLESGSTKGHVVTGSLGVVVALFGIALVFLTKPRLQISPDYVVRRSRRGR